MLIAAGVPAPIGFGLMVILGETESSAGIPETQAAVAARGSARGFIPAASLLASQAASAKILSGGLPLRVPLLKVAAVIPRAAGLLEFPRDQYDNSSTLGGTTFLSRPPAYPCPNGLSRRRTERASEFRRAKCPGFVTYCGVRTCVYQHARPRGKLRVIPAGSAWKITSNLAAKLLQLWQL